MLLSIIPSCLVELKPYILLLKCAYCVILKNLELQEFTFGWFLVI